MGDPLSRIVGNTTVLLLIASIVHEVNRRYCLALGDDSQPRWEDAPEWQVKSACSGIRDLIEGRTRSPAEQHAAWLQGKLDDGWKYGPVKDASKKEHPCMVAYDHLPPEQQVKDLLFRMVVADTAIALGLDVPPAQPVPPPPAIDDTKRYDLTKPEDLAEVFRYHAPSPDQLPRYEAVRSAALTFAKVLVRSVPRSADLTVAIRKVREAVMTANAAIALHGRI